MNAKQVKKGKKYIVSNGKIAFIGNMELNCFKVLGISKTCLKVEWENSKNIVYIPFEDFEETKYKYATYEIIEEVNW